MITNEILLCGRGYDSAGETFPFHGRLAFLSMWDTRLTPVQIDRLYKGVTGMSGTGMDYSSDDVDIVYRDNAMQLTRYTESGEQCEFPAIWSGELVYDCVTHEDGREKCFVGGRWEVCADKYGDGDVIIETERAAMMKRTEAGSRVRLVSAFCVAAGCRERVSARMPGRVDVRARRTRPRGHGRRRSVPTHPRFF